MEIIFDHEKLNVYQLSLDFVGFSEELLVDIPCRIASRDQLERASTSIPLNIAEGNGKSTVKDRCRYFYNARGSALECAACLDVLTRKRLIKEEVTINGKNMLKEIVSMLVGLIRSQDGDWEC